MMGYQPGFQSKLFYYQINLDQRVPRDHILRKIQKQIDFDFIYAEVEDSYGDNGNVSIPPPVILKMMLLLKALIALKKTTKIKFLAVVYREVNKEDASL